MLAQQNLAKNAILPQLDRLQPDHFQERQKHADQRLVGIHIAQDLLQAKWSVLERKATLQVVNHLSDGDRLFVHLEQGAGTGALQNLLERLYQIDHIGRDLVLGTLSLHEVPDRRVRADGI